MTQRLVPELDVSNLSTSLLFYTEICGFSVVYQRPEERFAYLDLEGAQLMLEEASGPGRRFHSKLEHPYGQGINLQIQVSDVSSIYQNVQGANAQIIVELEERWYRNGNLELGNRQFVAADPDGYLLRFFSDLGQRLRTLS